MNNAPIVRDICLVGGGHSHALLLRRWAMQPSAGIRLTLVSSAVLTPYSGMLPGLIAGHYAHDDIHIDLLRLCHWANVRFIENTITGIDLKQRHVVFNDRPALEFDVLSLDTGSTPDLSIPGARQYTVPVKPVSNFNERWQQVKQRLDTGHNAEFSIGVVGSGAGGFELVSAMQHQLRHTRARCYWFLRGDEAISGRPSKVGQHSIAAATAAGIEVVRQFDVIAVEPGQLKSRDGRSHTLDEIIWCTAATGPDWPTAAGLDVDTRGFVATNAFLQSTSHPFVFATGDVGTQIATPSSKAGVFAVRQAPILFKNLRNYLLGEALKPYKPQKDFLSLMATGPRHGIASRGPIVLQGNWVWRWKNYIDQTFMDRFRDLPRINMNTSLSVLPDALNEKNPGTPRCRGCGAKVGSETLQRVLDELIPHAANSNELSQWSPAGDTAVVDLPSQRLVQSVDQINAIIDDPYLLGRIAALHALSDVVTLNATPHSAQVLITLPEASAAITERDFRLMMNGLLSTLKIESCKLIGGHTSQGADMSIGLAINATIAATHAATYAATHAATHGASDTTNAVPKVQTGDALILTKALGIGTLFAGLMQGKTHGADISKAISSMLKSNRPAATIFRQHGSTAMTDITGFGLLGHLDRLLTGVSAGATIALHNVPFLPGAQALSQVGCKSSLWTQNSIAYSNATIDEHCDPALVDLLVDPQTSGGLLAIVPQYAASECIKELKQGGFEDAAQIGDMDLSGSMQIKT